MPHCEITLLSSPVVPATGDTIFYSPEVINDTPAAIVSDGWISLYKPAGREIYTLRFMDQETLIPDSIYSWNVYEEIMSNEAPGSYWMYVSAGDFSTGAVWNYQAFNFEKSDADEIKGGESSSTSYIPETFSAGSAFPNPFNSSVVIPFRLEEAANVRIAIYNELGREIALLTESVMPMGSHEIKWNGTSSNGAVVSSGIYFYRVDIGGSNLNKCFGYTDRLVMIR